MTHSLNRRQMLVSTGTVAACAILGRGRRALAAPPKAVIHETKVISCQPELYHGWPTVARRKSGELMLVYSGGREGHVCPFGRVELMRSHDEGKTWGWPRVVLDTEIDDRDAGVLETARGTLLVTTFTSLYFETLLAAAEKIPAGKPGAWPADRLERWQAAHNRISEAQRKALFGVWMLRSIDGGLTWSAPYDAQVSSPHGPFQLTDGRLLYAGNDFRRGRLAVCQSSDDGQNWQHLADIAVRPGDGPSSYYELHGVEAAPDRLVIQIRNEDKNDPNETLQTESFDGGKTWAVPHRIGVWGLPSHLLKLRDGHLLMTYGHRRAPLGNQARLSSDQGRTWSEPMIVSGDGVESDLGYPSTVQLTDGSLLSVWYELMKGSSHAVLRQAHWSLEAT